ARTKNGNIKRLKQVCCIGSVVRRAIVKNQNGWTGTTIGKFPFSKLNEPVTSAFSTQQSSSTYVSSTLYTSAAEQWKARQDFTSILKQGLGHTISKDWISQAKFFVPSS
ncbi:unnamed protein product, partial [Aphanomyces euteiches]